MYVSVCASHSNSTSQTLGKTQIKGTGHNCGSTYPGSKGSSKGQAFRGCGSGYLWCGSGCLFRLDVDPSEHVDLGSKPEHQQRVQEMRARTATLARYVMSTGMSYNRAYLQGGGAGAAPVKTCKGGTCGFRGDACKLALSKYSNFWGPFVDADRISGAGPWPCESKDGTPPPISCQKPCTGDACKLPPMPPMPPPSPSHSSGSHTHHHKPPQRPEGQCCHRRMMGACSPLKNSYCSQTEDICTAKCKGRWASTASALPPPPPPAPTPPVSGKQGGTCCHAGPPTKCLAQLNQKCSSARIDCHKCALSVRAQLATTASKCTDAQLRKWCDGKCQPLKNSFCSSSKMRCEVKCKGKWVLQAARSPTFHHETGRQCFDGKDNDHDGHSDCEDVDCLSDPRIQQRCQMSGGGRGGH